MRRGLVGQGRALSGTPAQAAGPPSARGAGRLLWELWSHRLRDVSVLLLVPQHPHLRSLGRLSSSSSKHEDTWQAHPNMQRATCERQVPAVPQWFCSISSQLLRCLSSPISVDHQKKPYTQATSLSFLSAPAARNSLIC